MHIEAVEWGMTRIGKERAQHVNEHCGNQRKSHDVEDGSTLPMLGEFDPQQADSASNELKNYVTASESDEGAQHRLHARSAHGCSQP